MRSPPFIPFVTLFAVLAVLPVLASWLIVFLPSRRREATGIIVGNPLNSAPLAPVVPVVAEPLVHLVRSLAGQDVEGFILGLRNQPVELAAPLLTRFVNGQEPALQLYAQGVLQQGRDDLSGQFQKLLLRDPEEPRTAAWLLETGLRLAHPSLCGATERPGFIKYLVTLAAHRLQVCEPSPSLLAHAAEIFTEAGLFDEATAALSLLPNDCSLASQLPPAIRLSSHQKALS